MSGRSMRVLITGGSGLLGRYLLKNAPDDVIVKATYKHHPQLGVDWHMPMEDAERVQQVFSMTKPDIVIHTAGETSVDKCERDFHAGYGVNIGGTYRVMQACLDYGAKFVGISSNAVYGGDGAPYNEGDPIGPVNYYGHTKVCMETATRHFFNDKCGWLIIRPILMYGWCWPGGRKNWAMRVVGKLRHNMPMKLITDTMTQPLYADDCAKAIWELATFGSGIYNIGGATKCTLYSFGQVVADVFGLDKTLITRCSSKDFPDMAPRPYDTTYTNRKMKEAGIEPVSIFNGLRRMRRERETTCECDDVHTQQPSGGILPMGIDGDAAACCEGHACPGPAV
jgi:dTDP-4-dehydrorhamnose reductase